MELQESQGASLNETTLWKLRHYFASVMEGEALLRMDQGVAEAIQDSFVIQRKEARQHDSTRLFDQADLARQITLAQSIAKSEGMSAVSAACWARAVELDKTRRNREQNDS